MRPTKYPKPKATSNALVPVSSAGTELALPADILASAKGFAKHSRSEATRKAYAYWWRDYTGWCDGNGRDPIPATVETVVGYVTGLATRSGKNKNGADTGRPLAIASIGQAMAAIKLAHRSRGVQFDSDNEDLKSVLKGIRRETAKVRPIRRVKPLMADDLRDLLESLRTDNLREARDAALLALGWAAAMRRSELVGLDWNVLGDGKDKHRTGYVEIDDVDGITVVLMTSKASQETAQTIVVPKDHAPLICKAVNNWIELAKIERGSPVFRPIKGKLDGKKVGASRLTTQTVARTIKRRIHVLIKSRSKGRNKMTPEDIKTLTALFSGHSMRVGYVTSAAERDIPSHRIRQQTRHKTEAMVSVYIRNVDIRKNSGLKGVGF